MFFNKRPKLPNEVFTPRSPDVNHNMYISRPHLEKELQKGVLGTKHLIMHGDSGSGKSWLYKKVLHDMKIKFKVVNLASAARHNSITEEFKLLLSSEQREKKVGYTEKVAGELNVGVAKGTVDNIKSYSVQFRDPVEEFFEFMFDLSKGKRSVIVFENLETIFNNQSLMDELGNLIILLDDERFSQYNVKFIIVGVPSGVIEYFSKVKNLLTISNRLLEIPEVARLSEDQISLFVQNGLVNELQIEFPAGLYEAYEERIGWVTTGLPESLHEYCLLLSDQCVENNRIAEENYLDKADNTFARTTLSGAYSVIDKVMNSIETVLGRRNQVLFTLGLVETTSFTASDIEKVFKREFPNTTRNVQLNISATLKSIEKFDDAPIKRTPKGNSWLFTHPKYLLCLRAILVKNAQEKVEKKEYNQII